MLHWKSFVIKNWIFFFLYRFQQGLRKNWKFDMSHCGTNDHKPPMNCYILDVLHTYKVLMENQRKWHDILLHPLFFTPKTRLELLEKEWFTKTIVGKIKLFLLSKCMIASLLELKWRKIINKTSRGITITRMLEA